MRPEPSPKLLLKTLKALLRRKRLGYRELCGDLGLSLPALKRAMNQEDISLARLLRLCELAGISLPALLEAAAEERGAAHRFPPEQEEFFAAHPHYLAYFFELHHARLQPAEIERRHAISPRSSARYLARLERFGLIRIGTGKVVRSLVAPVISWDDHGPIGRVLSSSMLLGLSRRVLGKIKAGSPAGLFLNGWDLRKEEAEAFIRDYGELRKKYQLLSSFHRGRGSPAQTEYLSVALMADHWDAKLFQKVLEL